MDINLIAKSGKGELQLMEFEGGEKAEDKKERRRKQRKRKRKKKNRLT
jgi:hypothetical protein